MQTKKATAVRRSIKAQRRVGRVRADFENGYYSEEVFKSTRMIQQRREKAAIFARLRVSTSESRKQGRLNS